MPEAPPIRPSGPWLLEALADGGRRLRRVPLLASPFRVGRRDGLDLSLPSTEVSSLHAELVQRDDRLFVRDLGSTNGTFVNRRRIGGETALTEGDIVHFASLEFRVDRLQPGHTTTLLGATTVIGAELPDLLIDRVGQLQELLERGSVTPVFQPIVALQSGETVAWEVLGRGTHEALPSGSHELFELAAVAGAEAELSRLFRRRAAPVCAALPGGRLFFLNTHPCELREEGLVDSLVELRRLAPGVDLALEIHESAVTDLRSIRDLKKALTGLGIGLAYDDFGAGRSRLLELADTPPDYLKFDRSLVHELDRAPTARRRLVEGLVELARQLEVVLIAEGLERPEEAELCRRLGFALGQGYHFGAPVAAEEAARREPQEVE